MALDDLSLDGGEGVGASNEAPSEKSEKQKEQSRKAQAQLQKTQKDEKKAKSDNDDLFLLLSRFINNPLYDELVPGVITLLQNTYPSRFVLVLISLVFPEASRYLLVHVGFEDKIPQLFNLYHASEKIPFDDITLHHSLRDWITLWLTATERFLTKDDASTLLTHKLSDLLFQDREHTVEMIFTSFFGYFFLSRNIDIHPEKSRAYANYIIRQMRDTLKNHLTTLDPDLRKTDTVDSKDLFGI